MTARDHKKLDKMKTHIQAATKLGREVHLALDAEYASQEPEWQEGAGGQRNVRISTALAVRTLALETLPGAEELG